MRFTLLALLILGVVVCFSSAQLAGGRQKVDINSEGVQEAAQVGCYCWPIIAEMLIRMCSSR
jgi:hypothetical protein